MVTDNAVVTEKTFGKFMKSFSTNISFHEQSNIVLIKYNKIMPQEKDLVETFNKHYMNIVENSREIKVYNVALEKNVTEDNSATDIIIKFYENHPDFAKTNQKASIQNSLTL